MAFTISKGPAAWLTNAALQSMIGATKLLPHSARVRFVGKLMTALSGPAGYLARAEDNLAMVWPDMAAETRKALAKQVANNAGRTLIENYSHASFGALARKSPLSGPGVNAMQEAIATNRPVIFLTGHFGNYEALRWALLDQGIEVGGLYRAMANVYFNAHYVRTMEDMSGPVFEQGRRGTAGFVKHLKSGGLAVLLFDIYEKHGVKLPFMGHNAPTALSAAELALKYDALLIPFFAIRQPDGLSFAVELDAPLAHTNAEQMMLDATRALEARITRYPEQWFWIHRRWKAHRNRGRMPALLD
ncbi:MAG: lysophospholipid acyltransferase family protein [Pseudomonadota bacterium]